MAIASAHIPDDSDLLKKIQEKAKAEYSGKVSAYVRELIEQDLSVDKSTSEADALSPTVIDELTRRLCGELVARELADGLATQARSYPNQAYLLRDLLFALTEFLAQGGTFNGQDEDETRPRITNYSSAQDASNRAEQIMAKTHSANKMTVAGLNRKIEKISPKLEHHD